MLTADAPAQPLVGSRTATLLHRTTLDVTECTLTWRRVADRRTIALMLLDGTTMVAESVVDFEDAVGALRLELEQRNLLLACNRFRRDAFVDDELRSATDGLGCYLVKSGRLPAADDACASLGEAPHATLAASAENIEFIRDWIRHGRASQVRTRRQPLPRLWIEAYVLWLIGELPDSQALRLDALAGRAGFDRSPAGAWQSYVERAVGITDDDRRELERMWEQSRAATAEQGIDLPPAAWAAAVVKANLKAS